jgi:hypothetical protein
MHHNHITPQGKIRFPAGAWEMQLISTSSNTFDHPKASQKFIVRE